MTPRVPSTARRAIGLRRFGRNLASGLRLALGLPVDASRFRVSAGQVVALAAFGIGLSCGLDWLRAGAGAEVNPAALQDEVFYLVVLMLSALLMRAVLRQPHLALAFPLVLLASLPLVDLGWLGYDVVAAGGAGTEARPILAYGAMTLWFAFVVWRSIAVTLSPRRPRFWRRTLAGAALFVALTWSVSAMFPSARWWQPPGPDALAGEWKSPASEQVLTAQAGILDDALAELDDQRPGVIDLYFVGFAPYASEDVFRKDVNLARDLMDDRFDTDGRSIVLVNNPRTMLEDPFATASNLRETLAEIGATIDRDEDIVMLYLTSHGTPEFELAADFPPLELDPLTPSSLRKMLDDAGIKWRIVVVSACYAGGFIDALKDANTLVMTASARDRRSFGCGTQSEATYFGDALFHRGLRFEDRFVAAFEKARDYVAERERAEHQAPPSDPQMDMGAAMADKIVALEDELRKRRAPGFVGRHPPRLAAAPVAPASR